MAKLNTKTIVLAGAEQAVKLSGQNCDVRNDGAEIAQLKRKLAEGAAKPEN